MTKYLADMQTQAGMEELAKNYPRVNNVKDMEAPRLDEELFHVVDHKVKTTDQSFQAMQRV